MIVALDTCFCVLVVGDDGEPNAYVGDPCDRHTGAQVSVVVAECRAKNAVVAAAGDGPGIVWGIADDGTVSAGTIDFVSGQIDVTAASAPLDYAAYLAAVADPSSLLTGD